MIPLLLEHLLEIGEQGIRDSEAEVVDPFARHILSECVFWKKVLSTERLSLWGQAETTASW